MRRVPDRFPCKARQRGTVGVAKSICADVSWRHLLVQSSELRAVRLCYLGRPPSRFRARTARASFSSVPSRLTCARVIRRSSRCGGIVYVDAYNDNARPLTHSAADVAPKRR